MIGFKIIFQSFPISLHRLLLYYVFTFFEVSLWTCEKSSHHWPPGQLRRTGGRVVSNSWCCFKINSWLVVWNMFFICPCIGKNNPNWLIFFRGVETTNQTESPHLCRITISKAKMLLTSVRNTRWDFFWSGLRGIFQILEVWTNFTVNISVVFLSCGRLWFSSCCFGHLGAFSLSFHLSHSFTLQ